jgi:hypothetical protein
LEVREARRPPKGRHRLGHILKEVEVKVVVKVMVAVEEAGKSGR